MHAHETLHHKAKWLHASPRLTVFCKQAGSAGISMGSDSACTHARVRHGNHKRQATCIHQPQCLHLHAAYQQHHISCIHSLLAKTHVMSSEHVAYVCNKHDANQPMHACVDANMLITCSAVRLHAQLAVLASCCAHAAHCLPDCACIWSCHSAIDKHHDMHLQT